MDIVKKCEFVLKRGERLGQQCGMSLRKGSTKGCYKHDPSDTAKTTKQRINKEARTVKCKISNMPQLKPLEPIPEVPTVLPTTVEVKEKKQRKQRTKKEKETKVIEIHC